MNEYMEQLVKKLSGNPKELRKYLESTKLLFKEMESIIRRERALIYFILILQFFYVFMKG